MKTTGVSDIPKFGLSFFLGHPNVEFILPPALLLDTAISILPKTVLTYGCIVNSIVNILV